MANLPRAPQGSTWTLDPQMLMDVAHSIQLSEGWEASMEVVELAMLEAERMISTGTTKEPSPPSPDSSPLSPPS